MRPAEILEKITETESAARHKIAAVRKSADELIQKARKTAEDIRQAGREKADLRANSMVKKAWMDAEETAARLSEKSQKERQRLAAVLAERVGETVQFVLKEFKKYYGSS